MMKKSLVVVTCYDFSFARIIADSGAIDYVLVGDSAANVIYGERHTAGIGLEKMLAHVGAVRRGLDSSKADQRPELIADLPAGAYDSVEAALRSSESMRREGAHWVKLEGPQIEVVRALSRENFKVCGHIGYTPQSIHEARVQGRDQESAQRLQDEARALEEAGCKMLVLELVPASLAQKITDTIGIPTIGIGAGVYCSGQVLVLYDLLGLNPDFKPKFLKKYLNAYELVDGALKTYSQEVRAQKFPGPANSYE